MAAREVTVTLDGRNYIAKFNLKTLASIDDATGRPPMEVATILSDPNRTRFDVAVRFVWGSHRVLSPELTIDKLTEIIAPEEFPGVLNSIVTPWCVAVTEMFTAEKSGPKAKTTDAPASSGAPSTDGALSS